MCSATTAVAADKSYNWTDNLPPVEVFAPVFNKVWAATAEPEPFASIKGKLITGKNQFFLWNANLLLPGAPKKTSGVPGCTIMGFAPTTTYSCTVSFQHFIGAVANLKNETEAQATFDSLVRLMARLRTDWAVSQPTRSVSQVEQISTQLSRVVFTIKHETTGGDDDLTKLTLETAAEVTMTQSEWEGHKISGVGISISSGHLPMIAESRFARVTNGNSNITLPSPQITSSPAATPASATVSFTNNSALPIEVLLAGPTISGKKIAPSETQDITIPSGKYSIVADFPASSHLLSYYGTQDYLANFHYVYKFDAPANVPANSTRTSADVESEIAKVLSQGQYSALPTRQVSQSGGSGLPTLVITNATQYNLRILASGPTPGDYTILPGATQNILVSPGSYKIAGTVSASDVLPFYGTENYAAGTRYIYSFYIK
jgi:hypothetical protein